MTASHQLGCDPLSAGLCLSLNGWCASVSLAGVLLVGGKFCPLPLLFFHLQGPQLTRVGWERGFCWPHAFILGRVPFCIFTRLLNFDFLVLLWFALIPLQLSPFVCKNDIVTPNVENLIVAYVMTLDKEHQESRSCSSRVWEGEPDTRVFLACL